MNASIASFAGLVASAEGPRHDRRGPRPVGVRGRRGGFGGSGDRSAARRPRLRERPAAGGRRGPAAPTGPGAPCSRTRGGSCWRATTGTTGRTCGPAAGGRTCWRAGSGGRAVRRPGRRPVPGRGPGGPCGRGSRTSWEGRRRRLRRQRGHRAAGLPQRLRRLGGVRQPGLVVGAGAAVLQGRRERRGLPGPPARRQRPAADPPHPAGAGAPAGRGLLGESACGRASPTSRTSTRAGRRASARSPATRWTVSAWTPRPRVLSGALDLPHLRLRTCARVTRVLFELEPGRRSGGGGRRPARRGAGAARGARRRGRRHARRAPALGCRRRGAATPSRCRARGAPARCGAGPGGPPLRSRHPVAAGRFRVHAGAAVAAGRGEDEQRLRRRRRRAGGAASTTWRAAPCPGSRTASAGRWSWGSR